MKPEDLSVGQTVLIEGVIRNFDRQARHFNDVELRLKTGNVITVDHDDITCLKGDLVKSGQPLPLKENFRSIEEVGQILESKLEEEKTVLTDKTEEPKSFFGLKRKEKK